MRRWILLLSATILVGACGTDAPTATPAPTATATPVPLPACGAANPASVIQTPVPVTPTLPPPTATRDPNAPTPTPRAPTNTPRPAPSVDRVGFPEGYQESYKQFFTFDRIDAKSISYICANAIAATVKPGEPFPYGSVLVFESWRPREDEKGSVILDANGHLIRSSLNTIFMMKKGEGFGEAYGPFRSGEWEYTAYRPDKSYQTTPQNSTACSACHVAAGKENDWVFRPELFHTPTRYGQTNPILTGANEVGISRMSFQPGTRSVKAGTIVKWTNSIVDKIDHNATALDGSFNSGNLKPGQSYEFTFSKTGSFAYVCTLHPDQMRGTITVTN